MVILNAYIYKILKTVENVQNSYMPALLSNILFSKPLTADFFENFFHSNIIKPGTRQPVAGARLVF